MKNISKAFCINCDEYKSYHVINRVINMNIRGIAFNYYEKEAHCDECGKELYVGEIDDENVETCDNAYREAAHLISIEQIRQLMEKYNIGAEPLALLLGYGKVTITRYLSGQLPSKDHSDRLLELLHSHRLMEECLETGKDRITLTAYKKCAEKLNGLDQLLEGNKINRVTRYLLYNAGDITPLALQKLLYYAEGFFHALFGTDLFTDTCEAWAHGPVYPMMYALFKDYGFNPIDKPTSDLGEDLESLAVNEKELLDAVIRELGVYSGKLLEDLTHAEAPWIEARGTLPLDARSHKPIRTETIHSYFCTEVRKYDIEKPADIEKFVSARLEELVNA